MLDLQPDVGQGQTLLHLSADRNLPGFVSALLELGADREARNEDGETALEMARVCGWKEVEVLLDR